MSRGVLADHEPLCRRLQVEPRGNELRDLYLPVGKPRWPASSRRQGRHFTGELRSQCGNAVAIQDATRSSVAQLVQIVQTINQVSGIAHTIAEAVSQQNTAMT